MFKLVIILVIIDYIITKKSICFTYGVHCGHTAKLFDKFSYKSKGEKNRRIRSWGTLLGSKYVRVRRAC
jgi:hypothetical protein